MDYVHTVNGIYRSIIRRIASMAFLTVLAAVSSCGDGADLVTPGTGGGTPGADSVPPAAVRGPVLRWESAAGHAVLSWRAPSDDPEHPGPVDAYDIRYSYAFPLKWDGAIAVAGPSPARPGSLQTLALTGLSRGRDVYAAIRSVDRAGNTSPLSDLAVTHVPGVRISALCHDVLTGAPVPGLAVRVTGRSVRNDTTADDGTFEQNDITTGLVTVEISRGNSPVAWHRVRDPFSITADTSLAIPMVAFQPAPSGKFESILSLLIGADAGVDRSGRFRKWNSLPVDVYVPAFVSPFGIDYGAAVLAAIDRWELRTGLDLFRVVGSVPATGVEFRYLPRSQMGVQNGFTEHFDDAGGLPRFDIVRILDEFTVADKLYRIMMHELGHTIRINHLPAGFIMFGGQPLPADITDDEVLLVQLHAVLPNGLDLSIYDAAPPAP